MNCKLLWVGENGRIIMFKEVNEMNIEIYQVLSKPERFAQSLINSLRVANDYTE